MAQPGLKVLAVAGSLHRGSVTRTVVQHVADQLRGDGCSVDLLDFEKEPLALYNPDVAHDLPGYQELQARVEGADVILLGTPDYHGSISGAMKNFLDHFWREFAGKLFATIVASHEKGLTVTDQLRTVARQCYAWTLPYGVAFTEDEDNKGVRVVMISHGLWQRRFGGAPNITGRKISINDEPFEVIGVMPPNFYFMPSRDIDVWMPASFPPWMRRNFTWHDAQIVGRLKPGVTLEHARQSMAALSLQVTAKDFRGPHSVFVVPLREEIAGGTQNALILLLGASAIVQ